MKDPIIDALHSQYVATTAMLALAIEHCPEEFWERVFGDESPLLTGYLFSNGIDYDPWR